MLGSAIFELTSSGKVKMRVQLHFADVIQMGQRQKALYHVDTSLKFISELVYLIMEDFNLNPLCPGGILLKVNSEFALLMSQPIAVLRENDCIRLSIYD